MQIIEAAAHTLWGVIQTVWLFFAHLPSLALAHPVVAVTAAAVLAAIIAAIIITTKDQA